MRRRILTLFVTTTLALSPFVRGDARSDAQHAQRRLEEAQCRVRDLATAIEHARLAVNSAVARRNQAVWSLQAAQSQVNASSAAIEDAQAKMDVLAEAARTAAARAEQRRADFDVAKNRLDEASRTLEKYRGDAIATFESSPAFKLAADELAATSTAYQGEVDAALDWLRSTDAYAGTYDFSEEMEEQVKAIREAFPPTPTALAAASQAWIDAKNALSKLKDDCLARDADVVVLRQQFELAQSRRKALVDRFNHDLAADESLKRLADAVAVEQATVAAAAQDINAANEQRAAAENGLAQLQSFINNERARLDQAQRDVASVGGFADSSWYHINHAQAELARLCDLERFARRDYELAAADLRRTIERADADHARREIEDRRERDHREAALAAGHERGGRASFVDIGVSARADTERRARAEAEQRERERRAAWERERHERENASKPSNPPPAQTNEEQRLASGEAAVARRQAIEARETTVPQRPVDTGDDRAARERAARETRESRARAQHDDQHRQARAQAQRDAQAVADREAKAQPDRAAQERAQRDGEREAKAAGEREARAQAEREARDARAKQEQQRREQPKREEDAREAPQQQQREERQRQDQQRQEQQQRAEQQRQERQREESNRQEQQRQERQREEQQRRQQDDQRKDQESRRREQEGRQQQQREQQQREQQREQERRRNDEDSRSRKDAEQRDRDRDGKFRK